MEKPLEHIIDEMSNVNGFQGCVFADSQGLCLGARGKADPNLSGIITALAEQARKLEPNSKEPIIILEGDSKLCTIQRSGDITGAIYKSA